MGMEMSEVLAATRAFLQQVKDLDDEEVEVPGTLIEIVDEAARECHKELEGTASLLPSSRKS